MARTFEYFRIWIIQFKILRRFINHNFGNDGDSTVVQAADCEVSQ